jgi:2-polyprenyl-3-methyl-5-hydroxy-6-metoxy-1,4-benzoquinol methylase
MDVKNPAYYDNINLDLLNAIPAGAELVLEIGCGAGRLGMAYKQQNPESRYYGVEIEAAAASTAAERLDMVLCGSVDSVDLSFLEGRVDCIVYGDVLEHLVDPWAVLKCHRTLLKPTGKMAACIPNIQHWSILAGLLQGSWAYHTDGLLDVTHLRFFTLSSIVSLFEGAGMTVENMIGRIIDADRAEAFFSRIQPSLAGMGIEENRFREQSRIFQYIVHAVPRST